MTFFFNGAGSKHDVVRQVRSHHIEATSPGELARGLVVDFMRRDLTDDYVYVVECSGHAGDGGASTINLSIKAFYVPTGWRHAPGLEEGLELGVAAIADLAHMTPEQAVEMLANVDAGKLAAAAGELARANPELFQQVAQAAGQQLLATAHELGVGVDDQAPELEQTSVGWRDEATGLMSGPIPG